MATSRPLRYHFTVLILILGVTACSQFPRTPVTVESPPSEETQPEIGISSPTPSATITPSFTPTQTPIPTFTQTPSLTPTPTLSPTPSPTSVAWSDQVISPENVGGLTQLAVWGRGRIEEFSTVRDANILLAKTPLGIYMYQADTLEPIQFVEQAVVYQVAPDEKTLATGDPEGVVALWDLGTGALIQRLETEIGEVQSGLFEMMMMDGIEIPAISAMRFSPNSRQLAVGYRDAVIRLWDASTGGLLQTLGHTVAPDPSTLAFSPQGDYLVSASNHLGIWRLEDGELLFRVPNAGSVSPMPFSPDGTQLVTSQWGGTLLIWKFPSGTLEHTYRTGLKWVQAVFSPDGENLVINDGEQIRRVWDGKLVSQESESKDPASEGIQDSGFVAQHRSRDLGHFAWPQGIRLLEDQSLLAWGGSNFDGFWGWEVLSGDWRPVSADSPMMANVTASYDGRWLYFCTSDGFQQMSMDDYGLQEMDRCRLSGVAEISSDGRWLARASGVLIDLFESPEKDATINLRGHTREVTYLRFSPDGKLLASSTAASGGGVELILWALDPLSRLHTLNVPSFGVSSAVFSHDLQMLATGGGDDKVRIWRVEDVWLLKILRLSSGATSMAFSPKGDLIAVGQWDGSLQVFGLPVGQELTRVVGHSDRIVDMVFTPRGDNLITVSTDGTVSLWGMP